MFTRWHQILHFPLRYFYLNYVLLSGKKCYINQLLYVTLFCIEAHLLVVDFDVMRVQLVKISNGTEAGKKKMGTFKLM